MPRSSAWLRFHREPVGSSNFATSLVYRSAKQRRSSALVEPRLTTNGPLRRRGCAGRSNVMSDHWDEIKRIFAKASSLHGKAREAYLIQACTSPDIRAEVDSLLAEHDRPGSFLQLLSTLEYKTVAHYEIGE